MDLEKRVCEFILKSETSNPSKLGGHVLGYRSTDRKIPEALVACFNVIPLILYVLQNSLLKDQKLFLFLSTV